MNPGTRLLIGEDGQRFLFDPGSFCLELLLTGGPAQRDELLRAPTDVTDWLAGSRLASAAPVTDVRVRLTELRQLKEFRDTMWSVARGLARGDTVEPRHVELINDCAGATLRPELDPAGVRRWASPVTGDQILGAAARDAIELIGQSVDRLRECHADDCSLLFVDTSRPGSRRWCSMQRCGNRNKVKSYRNRQG